MINYHLSKPLVRNSSKKNHLSETKPLIFHHFLRKICLPPSPFLSAFQPRNGSRADLHTRAGEVFADADPKSESCFGVSVPIHCHHLVLYSRCHARQLRSTGVHFSIPTFWSLLGLLDINLCWLHFLLLRVHFLVNYLLMSFECLNVPHISVFISFKIGAIDYSVCMFITNSESFCRVDA